MGRALRQLGSTGLILLAALLIFACLGAGVVIHRLESTSPAANHQPQSGDQQGNQSKKTGKPAKPSPKPKESPEPKESPDPQDND